MADLAERIHEDALAALIRRIAAGERDASVPAVLRSTATRSRTTAPRSYRLRLELALRRTAAARALRRIPVVRHAYQSLRRPR
jgi:hypothetical protein